VHKDVKGQTTDLKLEHAKRLPFQYSTSHPVSSSSEQETTDLKLEHDERLPLFPTSQPVSSSSKHETTDLKKRVASQFLTLKPISSSSEHGYVVGMYYWEQLTMASNSLLELLYSSCSSHVDLCLWSCSSQLHLSDVTRWTPVDGL